MLTKQFLIDTYNTHFLSPDFPSPDPYYEALRHWYHVHGGPSTSYDSVSEMCAKDITRGQWANIVEVFAHIKANQEWFDMTDWHTEHECGTSHCIGGWTEVLFQGETPCLGSPFQLSVEKLSIFMVPFLFVTRKGSEKDIMEHLIEPVLAHAAEEGLIPI